MGFQKEIARSILYQATVRLQLCRLSRFLFNNNGAVIFYGHRVTGDNEGYLAGVSPEDFENQIRYLSDNYNWMKLSDLVECLNNSKPIPANSVVLTFDDGFRDNYTGAFPILKKYRVPATIFLATGCISDNRLPWSEQLGYLFQNAKESTIRLQDLNIPSLEIRSTTDRKKAYSCIKNILSEEEDETQQKFIRIISEQLEVDLPTDRMMTWDQIIEMSQFGIEFGCHTRSHALLAKVSHEYALKEMQWSLDDLKQVLPCESPAFCFPGGSMNQILIGKVPHLGFSSVFIPNRKKRVNNETNSHAFNLSRLGLPNGPAFHLEAELDGPFHRIRNLYRFGTR